MSKESLSIRNCRDSCYPALHVARASSLHESEIVRHALLIPKPLPSFMAAHAEHNLWQLSKQEMATEHYSHTKGKRVLEIGCSVGNISAAFRAFPNVVFTGIDIDRHAIELAKRRFHKDLNFRLCLSSLEELSRQGELFAGILYHVDDNTGLQLLRDAVKCTERGGHIVIYEPESPRQSDGWVLRNFCSNFEQGAFLRSRDVLTRLVEHGGIALKFVEDRMVSPGIVKHPYVARFNLLVGKPIERSTDALSREPKK